MHKIGLVLQFELCFNYHFIINLYLHLSEETWRQGDASLASAWRHLASAWRQGGLRLMPPWRQGGVTWRQGDVRLTSV